MASCCISALTCKVWLVANWHAEAEWFYYFDTFAFVEKVLAIGDSDSVFIYLLMQSDNDFSIV